MQHREITHCWFLVFLSWDWLTKRKILNIANYIFINSSMHSTMKYQPVSLCTDTHRSYTIQSSSSMSNTEFLPHWQVHSGVFTVRIESISEQYGFAWSPDEEENYNTHTQSYCILVPRLHHLAWIEQTHLTETQSCPESVCGLLSQPSSNNTAVRMGLHKLRSDALPIQNQAFNSIFAFYLLCSFMPIYRGY